MNGQTICRACGSKNLYLYLPLGDHPPANAFVRADHLHIADHFYPLETRVCLECALIQVPDPLPSDYYVDYVYVPSASTTMPLHFSELARRFATEFVDKQGGLVVDIGSNDGLLLGACLGEGLRVLGIDPSSNISAMAREKGVEVFNEYFTGESAKRIKEKYGAAHVIVSTNTVNHIDDLNDFMHGIDTMLAPNGTFVIEVPQALTCIQFNEFDTVYHEHLSTFAAASIAAMGKKVGLILVDMEELPIHGGSMRLFLRRSGQPSAALTSYLQREQDAGLFGREVYDDHRERVHANRDALLALLAEIKAAGKTVAGYSAPAKGNTLLNYFQIGTDTLMWIADRNELKQGRYTPGMRIPVVSPDRIKQDNPDYILILAWNFKEEIMEQLAAYHAAGGKFIVPVPKIAVV